MTAGASEYKRWPMRKSPEECNGEMDRKWPGIKVDGVRPSWRVCSSGAGVVTMCSRYTAEEVVDSASVRVCEKELKPDMRGCWPRLSPVFTVV